MRLPNNEIGISDINQYRDCPRRFGFGIRRWTEGEEPPEAVHPDTMYGTIFHDTVEQVEKHDLSEDQALTFAFNKFSAFLGPDDLEKIKADLALYWEREDLGVRTVANEGEIRTPLLRWCFGPDGESCTGEPITGSHCPVCNAEPVQIYFRARIDRLYQRLDDERIFIHRDYKSSKWKKSEADVHKDPQMWSYNWVIFEHWPEIEYLTQIYDQLRHGAVPTQKNAEQRAEIKEWLIRQVTAILNADAEPLPATLNTWCPWCPIKYDCPVIDRLTDFEAARIAAMVPSSEDVELEGLAVYVDKLPKVQTAIKTLKEYEDRVRGLLRGLPSDRREALGYRTSTPRKDVWTNEALERVYEILGPADFFAVSGMSKRQVSDYLKGDPRLSEILDLAVKVDDTPRLTKISFD